MYLNLFTLVFFLFFSMGFARSGFAARTARALLLPLLLSLCHAHCTARGSLRRSRLLKGAAAALTIPAATIEIYARLPPPPSQPPLELPSFPSEAERIVVVIPGAGGPDENTLAIRLALAQAIADSTHGSESELDARRDARGSGARTAVVELDWRRWKGDELRAPYNARRVGAQLGRALAQLAPRTIHLVGVSVGAHVADAAAEALSGDRPSSANVPHVHLTLCDPFCGKGLLDLLFPERAFGVREFGASAHYCEALINCDDPVPTTNLPLRRALNYDLTAAAARRSFAPLEGDSLHSWPAAWYAANCREMLQMAGKRPTHGGKGATNERGKVVAVE